jgi:hypothetical protein
MYCFNSKMPPKSLSKKTTTDSWNHNHQKLATLQKKDFTKKKNPPAVCRVFMAVKMQNFSVRFLKDAFKLDTSPFGSQKQLVKLEFSFLTSKTNSVG